MKHNLILEVNRIKEIMGLVLEQEEGANWKDYANGAPATLFYEKATSRSKKYMESDLEVDTVAEWKTQSRYRVSKDDFMNQKGQYAESKWKEYENWVDPPIVGDYLYFTSMPGSWIRVEENPDFIQAIRSIVGSDYPSHTNSPGKTKEKGGRWRVEIPGLPSSLKLEFMKYIEQFVESNYKGNYDKASRKIQKIEIKKGKMISTEEKEEQSQPNGIYSDYSLNGVEGTPFVNNEWVVSEDIKEHIQETKALITQVLNANPGVTATIVNKVRVDGKELNVPYSISTSASRYRNTGNAENYSFAQLSQKRAEEIHQYVISELGGLVEFPQPILHTKGGNGDGSSGPNPPAPNQFSDKGGEPDSFKTDGDRNLYNGKDLQGNTVKVHKNPKDYEKYKYCRVIFAVSFTGEETKPGIPSSGRLGEWSIKIDDEKERKQIDWPEININWNFGGGGKGKGGNQKCAAYM